MSISTQQGCIYVLKLVPKWIRPNRKQVLQKNIEHDDRARKLYKMGIVGKLTCIRTWVKTNMDI